MESTAKFLATSNKITKVHGHRNAPSVCIWMELRLLENLQYVHDNLKHIQCKTTYTKENTEERQNMVQWSPLNNQMLNMNKE